MQRCDCCQKFGELESITLEVKKHPSCDVNVLFGHPQMVKLPQTLSPEQVARINQQEIIEDMPPMNLQEAAMAKILREGGTLSK